MGASAVQRQTWPSRVQSIYAAVQRAAVLALPHRSFRRGARRSLRRRRGGWRGAHIDGIYSGGLQLPTHGCHIPAPRGTEGQGQRQGWRERRCHRQCSWDAFARSGEGISPWPPAAETAPSWWLPPECSSIKPQAKSDPPTHSTPSPAQQSYPHAGVVPLSCVQTLPARGWGSAPSQSVTALQLSWQRSMMAPLLQAESSCAQV